MGLAIKVRGQYYLDLFNVEYIGVDNSIFDLKNLKTRQGSSTNDFNIPDTSNNRIALGYSTVENVDISDYRPSERIPAELVQNNICISNGFIQVVGKDKDISITFFGENIDVFEQIKGRLVSDIDLSEYDHIYNSSNIIASFNNTYVDAYKYLPIDYGTLTERTELFIDSGEIFPSVYVYPIVKTIFSEIGYKLDGSLLDRAKYKKAILPFSNPTYAFGVTENYADDKKFYVKSFTDYVDNVFNPSDNRIYEWNEAANIPTGFVNRLFDFNLNKYVADDNYTLDLVVRFDLTRFRELSGFVNPPQLIIKINGVQVATTGVNKSTSLPYRATLVPGDYIEVFVNNDTIDPIEIELEFTGSIAREVLLDSTFHVSSVLPAIQQTDFIKWVLYEFCGVLSVDNISKTVYLNQFNDIKNNSVDDWSGKLDISRTPKVSYTSLVNSYAVSNIMAYELDESDIYNVEYNSLNGVPFGSAKMIVNNDFLEGENELFKTVFAGTFIVDSFGTYNIKLPFIPRYVFEEGSIKFISSDVSSHTDGNLKLSIDTAPNLVVGGFVQITDSIPAYNGVWKITTLIDNNTFVLNTPYTSAVTGSVKFFSSEVNSDLIPRCLIDYGVVDIFQLGEVAEEITIIDTVVTQIPFSFFYKPQMGFVIDGYRETLAFGYQNIFSANDYGPLEYDYDLINSALNTPVTIEAYLLLNQIDMVNLDFLKKKYIERLGGSFYLNKIDEYDGSGNSVKCELIKL
jgi:hypothetical protein